MSFHFPFKAHLFDIDIKGVYSFAESSKLTPGDKLTTFTIDGVKFGLGVCFDIYFDEYARALRSAGVYKKKLKFVLLIITKKNLLMWA